MPDVSLDREFATGKRLRVGLFIDHDIIVRHFLASDAFAALIAAHDVVLVVPPEGHRRLTLDVTKYSDNARIRRLDIVPARRSLHVRLLQVHVLRPKRDEHLRYMRQAWRGTMNRRAFLLHSVLALPGLYALFRRYVDRKLERTPFVELDQLLDEEQFDVVINPGVPIGIYLEDLLAATARRRLPFIQIMNSWDNPSLTIWFSGLPDHFLVWGEQTYRHALRFIGMPEERVHKFGAAQFEVYRNPPRIDRDEFCARHGINPAHRLILYAGGSLGTNEREHLAFLESLIDSGRLGAATIVYRPHPWGGGGNHGEEIIEQTWRHVRIESTMARYLEELRNRGYHMTFPDYRDTHDVLSAVDCVVSPLSTILIEAALHGKPILCFLPIEDANAEHFHTVRDLPHFEDLIEDTNVLVAQGREALAAALPTLIAAANDPDYAMRIRRTAGFFVEEHNESYGDRLRSFVESLAAASETGMALSSKDTAGI